MQIYDSVYTNHDLNFQKLGLYAVKTPNKTLVYKVKKQKYERSLIGINPKLKKIQLKNFIQKQKPAIFQICNTSQVIHAPKKFIDKYTCTTEDYFMNCSKAISDQPIRQFEFDSIVQFANESIAIMGEALQNKILHQYKEKGKPEELEKLMNAIKFKKEDLDNVVKGVDLDLLKDKVENYEFVESEIKNHIIQLLMQNFKEFLFKN